MTADDVEHHRLVAAAAALARDLLTPNAAVVDAGTVPRSHLDAIGDAGLLGLLAPTQVGGTAASPAVIRRVTEILAGADAATWFVQAQHHSPVKALAASGTHPETLRDLAAGRLIAGVAFSHLRRWPARPLAATRVAGGWRFDGVAPWYTGWGLNDVALVGAASEAGEVVFTLAPARESVHVHASAPMDVAALRAALTVSLRIEGLQVPDGDVVSVQPIAQWAVLDRRVAVNVNPAVFGVATSALTLLARAADERDQPAAGRAASRIGEQLEDMRVRAYRLMDDVGPDEAGAARLTLRAQAHRLMIEATTALVISGAGGALAMAAPAQRKVREAMFLLVQAQTGDARTAALDLWGTP